MKKFLKLIFLTVMLFTFTGCGEVVEDVPAPPENKPVEEKITTPSENKTSENKISENKKEVEKIKTPPPAPTVQNKPVVISFAGDCTLGSFIDNDLFENYWANGAGYYLGNVKNIFGADDITFVNLEGPLTYSPRTAVKKFPMRGDPKYIEILKAGSVEVCNLSNNHIYDCGDAGFYDTVELLKANNIKYCGEGYNSIIEVRGLKIGFLGFQGWYDGADVRNEISAAINQIRQNVDVVIAEFHWGEEKAYFSDPEQDSLAHFTIDSGADIVVGAHPHVMQGIELYRGKIIAYSLGNFCFGANANPVDKDTFILQTSISKSGKNLIIIPNVIPCKISSTDSYNDFCPTPASGNEAARILTKLADSSKIYNQTINF